METAGLCVHAQGVVVNELLLLILNAFCQYTRCTQPEMLHVSVLYVVRELSVPSANSSLVFVPLPAVPRTAPDTTIPRGNHVVICGV